MRRGRWDRQALVAGIVLVIRERPSRQLRRTDLNALADDDARIPHASTVGNWIRQHPADAWDALRGSPAFSPLRTAR